MRSKMIPIYLISQHVERSRVPFRSGCFIADHGSPPCGQADFQNFGLNGTKYRMQDLLRKRRPSAVSLEYTGTYSLHTQPAITWLRGRGTFVWMSHRRVLYQ